MCTILCDLGWWNSFELFCYQAVLPATAVAISRWRSWQKWTHISHSIRSIEQLGLVPGNRLRSNFHYFIITGRVCTEATLRVTTGLTKGLLSPSADYLSEPSLGYLLAASLGCCFWPRYFSSAFDRKNGKTYLQGGSRNHKRSPSNLSWSRRIRRRLREPGLYLGVAHHIAIWWPPEWMYVGQFFILAFPLLMDGET